MFAGVKRRSDLGSCLRRQGRRHKVSVIVEEVDVLRDSKKHNLLSPRRRKQYLRKVKGGNYFAVVASPPCGTFSRSRWRPGGPKPLRLQHCPRGFPWLSGLHKASVRQANALVDFSADCLRAQFMVDSSRTGLLEHPEDLGVVHGGDHPGCSWHFNNVRALLDISEVITGALAQSDWGRPYPKPTRLLGRLPGMQDILAVGWPSLNNGR